MDSAAKLELSKPLLEYLGGFFILCDALHHVDQALIVEFVREFVDADLFVVMFLYSRSVI